MKVRVSVKPICGQGKVIKRHGKVLYVKPKTCQSLRSLWIESLLNSATLPVKSHVGAISEF